MKLVLELGCGTGGLLEYLTKKGLSVVGIDISEYACKTCRNKGFDIVMASATHLPFRDKSFNYTVSQHVLEHTDDHIKALFESIRVSKEKAVHVLPGHFSTDMTHNINHFTEDMVKDMVNLLEKKGYRAKYYPEYPNGRVVDRDWVIVCYIE